MTRKIFTHAKKILPFIGIAILIYIVFNLDLGEIKDDILSIHPSYIAIALSLTIPRLILRNYAWQLIQKEHKIKLSYFQSLKIFLIGYFYGNITPGYLGQLMRIPYMKEKTKQPYGKLFVNTTIETIVHTCFTRYTDSSTGFPSNTCLDDNTRNNTYLFHQKRKGRKTIQLPNKTSHTKKTKRTFKQIRWYFLQ